MNGVVRLIVVLAKNVGIAILLLLLAAFLFKGQSKEEREAERLGFDDISEMQEIHKKGWHTKAQYLADESARANKLGFSSLDKLHDADRAGFSSKADYEKHLEDKARREADATETASATASYDVVDAGALSIDGGQLSAAIFQGQDDFGKTKEEYFLSLKRDQTVRVYNAFIYATDTSAEDWYIRIGYSRQPAISCRQKTQDAKREVMKIKSRIENATVVGEFKNLVANRVYLENCKVTGGFPI